MGTWRFPVFQVRKLFGCVRLFQTDSSLEFFTLSGICCLVLGIRTVQCLEIRFIIASIFILVLKDDFIVNGTIVHSLLCFCSILIEVLEAYGLVIILKFPMSSQFLCKLTPISFCFQVSLKFLLFLWIKPQFFGSL